jgi:hypothetical protein
MFARLLCLPAVLVMTSMAWAADADPTVRYSARARFENVRDDLVSAITGRGLVIDHNSHIGKMLDRTGKDLGATKRMYGEDQGQSFSFCSGTVSRKTMEADPHNIVFCPYTISVYSLRGEPDKVYVAYRRPLPLDSNAASKKALQEVEALLDGIAREALNLPAK